MFPKEHFRVLPEHVALLQNACVRWDSCEFGAPAIDSKRPYGHSGSQIYLDMANIIGLTPASTDDDDEPACSDEQVDHLHGLHTDLETVLQIFLHTGVLQSGLCDCSPP